MKASAESFKAIEQMAQTENVRTTRKGPSFPALACGGLGIAAFFFLAYQQISDGRLFVDLWSGDVAFVFDVILRIANGQVPHVDFTLHLGAFPYLLAAGIGGGTVAENFLMAQAIFVAACLIAALWVWWTRLNTIAGALLLAIVVFLGMSLTIPTQQDRSLAMFYNRWGWVMTLLFASLTFLPAASPKWSRIDGVLAGALAFVLFMTKVTFFVGLIPAVLLCGALRSQWREIGFAVSTFLFLVMLCLIAQPMMLPGYFENMAWAAVNPLRPNAGTGFSALLSGNGFLAYTIIFALFLIAVLRTHGPKEAAWLTVAAIGFYFIQYQNKLTAPFWVLFLLIYAAVYADRAAEVTLRRVWFVIALALAVFSFTLLHPMTSGIRPNPAVDEAAAYMPFPPAGEIVTGAYIRTTDIEPIVKFDNIEFPDAAPWTGNPECNFQSGWIGAKIKIAQVLADLPGPAFITDSITPHWYLAGVDPLPGAALWNYGSVRGISNAEYVIVPDCAIRPDFKREILRETERQGISLIFEFENEHAAIYRIER